MKDKFLPIGSVVLLNGAKKRLMITGYAQIDLEKNDKIYDYCGCFFPEGVIASDKLFVFDHKDISQVFFTGYSDEEQQKFNERLVLNFTQETKNKLMDSIKNKNEIEEL